MRRVMRFSVLARFYNAPPQLSPALSRKGASFLDPGLRRDDDCEVAAMAMLVPCELIHNGVL